MQVIETLNEIILTMDEEHRAPPTKVDRISHACIQYVNKHLCEKKKLSPQNIASKLHISPSHLQHAFKKEIGLPLHAYVFNQKMGLAHKLLSQGQPPQEVANTLGYEYYSTFYHNFVKRFGVTPQSFAKGKN